MSMDGKYIEQRTSEGDTSQSILSSRRQYQEMFYPKKHDSREAISQLSSLQKRYESIPSVTLEKDHREDNMRNKLLRYDIQSQHTYLKLRQVSEKIQEISNANKKPDDRAILPQLEELKKFEGILQISLERKKQYEINLVQRVSQLKSVLKEVQLLDKSQSSRSTGADLARTIQNNINEAHVLLVGNSDHLGTNTQGYFHESQLHPCPPELRIKMLKQESGANDCGPACVVALYAARQQVSSWGDLPTNIYRKYSQDEINTKGTTRLQHVQVLRELGIRTEIFSSTYELRMRLNKSERVNPILASIGRYDIDKGHFITIADKTTHHDGEEMIAFADPGTGDSYLISFNDFLHMSYGEYLRTI